MRVCAGSRKYCNVIKLLKTLILAFKYLMCAAKANCRELNLIFIFQAADRVVRLARMRLGIKTILSLLITWRTTTFQIHPKKNTAFLFAIHFSSCAANTGWAILIC